MDRAHVNNKLDELLLELKVKAERMLELRPKGSKRPMSTNADVMSVKGDVMRLLQEILSEAGMNAAKLSFGLGISDQKVYRWLNIGQGSYMASCPLPEEVGRIREAVLDYASGSDFQQRAITAETKVLLEITIEMHEAMAEFGEANGEVLVFLIRQQRAAGEYKLTKEACRALAESFIKGNKT